MIKGRLRRFLRQCHLLCALVFGALFFMSGLTGTVLAWRHELEPLLSPELFVIASDDMNTLPPACDVECKTSTANWLARLPGYGLPAMLSFPENPHHAVVAWYRIKEKAGDSLRTPASRQVMIDPYRQRILGERIWGQAGWKPAQWLPTLYHLHRYLLLGEAGKTVMAVSGLFLIFTALQGMLLWLPASVRAVRKALSLRLHGSLTAITHQWHKTAGVFAALILIMLGFTGAWFNQAAWFAAILPLKVAVHKAGEVRSKSETPLSVTLPAALKTAQQLFPDARISRIGFSGQAHAFEIRLLQPAEARMHDGATRVSVNAEDGKVMSILDPKAVSGREALISWFFPLHSGEALGYTGKLFISLSGLVLMWLVASGIYLWLRRSKR